MSETGRCVLMMGDQVRIWSRQKDKSALSFDGIAILDKFEGKTRAGVKAGDPAAEQWLVKFADGHKETRWVSFLDLYVGPKTYADAAKDNIANAAVTSLLAQGEPKGYNKGLLKLAATVIVDCVRCPESMNVQKSLDELPLESDKPDVYAMLLEFAKTLEDKYGIESVWEEVVDERKFDDQADELVGGLS